MWMNREGEHIIKLCKVEEIKIIKEREKWFKNGSKIWSRISFSFVFKAQLVLITWIGSRMRLITEVVCNLKTIQNVNVPPALDNKTEAICVHWHRRVYFGILNKQEGCVCVCVWQTGWAPLGPGPANSGAAIRCLSRPPLMRCSKPTGHPSAMWPACVQRRRYVSMSVVNEPSNPMHSFVRGSRMIHLAVLLPAAVRWKLITQGERERGTERGRGRLFPGSPQVFFYES